MITTEMAFAIPALVAIAVTCAWFISLAIVGVQLNSLSATYARVLARGDRISPEMQAQLPEATNVEVTSSGDLIEVKLTARKRFPIPNLKQTVDVHGAATARLETMP